MTPPDCPRCGGPQRWLFHLETTCPHCDDATTPGAPPTACPGCGSKELEQMTFITADPLLSPFQKSDRRHCWGCGWVER